MMNLDWQIQSARKLPGKGLVRVGCRAAQSVVHVNESRESRLKFGRELSQQPGERDRVRAAGDGDGNTVISTEKLPSRDGACDAVDERAHGPSGKLVPVQGL